MNIKFKIKKGDQVVVIDDEVAVSQAIMRSLAGVSTRSFSSAREALRSIEARPPHVIICDIMMPEMNGIEVYQALKTLGLASRSFLITGGSISTEVTRFIEEERPTVLYKPFSPQELRAQVWRSASVSSQKGEREL